MSDTFNEAQKICASTYASGDFSYASELKDCENVGDGLFTFLMTELSSKEDCTDLDVATQRLETVVADIQKIAAAVNQVSLEDSCWVGGQPERTLNGAQKAMIQSYANGDYAHIKDPAEADDTFDGLLPFLMRELGYENDCDSAEEALRRLDNIQREVQEVLDDVYQASLKATAPTA